MRRGNSGDFAFRPPGAQCPGGTAAGGVGPRRSTAEQSGSTRGYRRLRLICSAIYALALRVARLGPSTDRAQSSSIRSARRAGATAEATNHKTHRHLLLAQEGCGIVEWADAQLARRRSRCTPGSQPRLLSVSFGSKADIATPLPGKGAIESIAACYCGAGCSGSSLIAIIRSTRISWLWSVLP